MHFNHLQWLLPNDFDEYREPLVGGGSIFLIYKRRFPHRKYWINDMNENLICFWKTVQTESDAMVEKLLSLRSKYTGPEGGRTLRRYAEEIYHTDSGTQLERGIAYFIMQCSSFGTIENGNFTATHYINKFTQKKIRNLRTISRMLQGTKITLGDYGSLLDTRGENVFLFLDPPYTLNQSRRLYGKNGSLHRGFDHSRFYAQTRTCSHKWLLTYDWSQATVDAFSDFNVTNVKVPSRIMHTVSNELVIDNFRPSLSFS